MKKQKVKPHEMITRRNTSIKWKKENHLKECSHTDDNEMLYV